MGAGAVRLQGHGEAMPVKRPLSRTELEALHSVLRRAAERAERNKDRDAEKLAIEVAAIADELAR